MKNLLLVAIGLLLFVSCKKEEEGPKGDEFTGRIYRLIRYPQAGTEVHTDMVFEKGNHCSLKSTSYRDTISEDIGGHYLNYMKIDNTDYISIWEKPNGKFVYYISSDSLYQATIRGDDTTFERGYAYLRVQ